MTQTASAFDVARYVLLSLGPMTAMKLQKLVYYCQAWSLVWDETPLFGEPIEAWANGPVVPALYASHKGKYLVDCSTFRQGEPSRLDAEQRETIDAVLKFYGDKTAQWLSDQTHSESPWREARVGLSDSERGTSEISLAALHEYYSSLPQ